jgi:hypothetical protein
MSLIEQPQNCPYTSKNYPMKNNESIEMYVKIRLQELLGNYKICKRKED